MLSPAPSSQTDTLRISWILFWDLTGNGNKEKGKFKTDNVAGEEKTGSKKSQNLDPKGKNSVLGQNGGTRRRNRFQNKDNKYSVMPVKLDTFLPALSISQVCCFLFCFLSVCFLNFCYSYKYVVLWYLDVLICNSLMTYNFKHLFICV